MEFRDKPQKKFSIEPTGGQEDAPSPYRINPSILAPFGKEIQLKLREGEFPTAANAWGFGSDDKMRETLRRLQIPPSAQLSIFSGSTVPPWIVDIRQPEEPVEKPEKPKSSLVNPRDVVKQVLQEEKERIRQRRSASSGQSDSGRSGKEGKPVKGKGYYPYRGAGGPIIPEAQVTPEPAIIGGEPVVQEKKADSSVTARLTQRLQDVKDAIRRMNSSTNKSPKK